MIVRYHRSPAPHSRHMKLSMRSHGQFLPHARHRLHRYADAACSQESNAASSSPPGVTYEVNALVIHFPKIALKMLAKNRCVLNELCHQRVWQYDASRYIHESTSVIKSARVRGARSMARATRGSSQRCLQNAPRTSKLYD